MLYCPSVTAADAEVWLLDADDEDKQKHSPTWSATDFNVTGINNI